MQYLVGVYINVELFGGWGDLFRFLGGMGDSKMNVSRPLEGGGPKYIKS